MKKLRVLDLFSGIGGFSLGLERTGGFETVAFCEIEEYPRRVLAKHWPKVPCYHDVRELTADALARDGIAVDVICGGFPCQDISFAGKGAGLAGERSGLWFHYARLIGELRPSYVIVENVAALLSRGLADVLGSLASLGYDAEWHCIPASAVGAPHRRDRLWIVAYPEARQHEGDCAPIGGTLAAELFVCASDAETVQRIAEQWNEPDGDSASIGALANANGIARDKRRACDASKGAGRRNADRGGVGASAMANAEHGGREGRDEAWGRSRAVMSCSWWGTKSYMGGMVDGIPGASHGDLNAEEHHTPKSTKSGAKPDVLSGMWRNRKVGTTSPRLQQAGGCPSVVSGMSCESGPARRNAPQEKDEDLRAVRDGVHAEAQQEAHAMQRPVQIGNGPDQRREALGTNWLVEPEIPRVAAGVKYRVARLKGLGNAVVPQIPQLIGQAILKAEGMTP